MSELLISIEEKSCFAGQSLLFVFCQKIFLFSMDNLLEVV